MLYCINTLNGKKKHYVIKLECLKLGWKCIFTHVTIQKKLYILQGLKIYPDNGLGRLRQAMTLSGHSLN
jgi:allantoicase